MVRNAVKKEVKMGNAKCSGCSGSMGCVYGLGFVGAVVYYIINATGFWNGVLGILKAVVWPAVLVYEFLKFVGA
jgi:hypothetical protein